MNFKAICKYLASSITNDIYTKETVDGHTLIDGLILNTFSGQGFYVDGQYFESLNA